MALTNITTVHSQKTPSAPMFAVKVTADMDASYPAGGYPLNELGSTDDAVQAFPGAKIIQSVPVPHFDGTATTRWFRLVDASGVAKLACYADSNGTPGGEVSAATDLSAHTGVEVEGLAQ